MIRFANRFGKTGTAPDLEKRHHLARSLLRVSGEFHKLRASLPGYEQRRMWALGIAIKELANLARENV